MLEVATASLAGMGRAGGRLLGELGFSSDHDSNSGSYRWTGQTLSDLTA